jgi:hypothetical protein
MTFDRNPGHEFDFFLATELGMSVAHLRATVSNLEVRQWAVYYARKAQREELQILKEKARAKKGKR